jgi:1-acyl-sn-glycerol-3-phosphate acyltransferase
VLLGITIDYALHLFTHLRDTGDRRQAITELTWPILVSSLTTAAAFACLYVVRSDGLHDLGAFAALSVTATAIFALIMIPLLPVKLKSVTPARTTFIEQWAAYPIHRKKWMRWLLLIVSIACLFGAGKVAFEDDLYKINFMSARTTASEQHLNALTSATHRGVYLATSGVDLEEALVFENPLLPLLDSLKSEAVITQYAAIGNLIPSRIEQELRIARWNAFWTQERIDQTMQALSAEASILGFRAGTFSQFEHLIRTPGEIKPADDFKPVADAILPGYISQDSTRTTVLSLLSVATNSAAEIYPYFDRRDHVRILDKAYLVSRFVDILRNDFRALVLLSFFIVFFILHITLGRIELALITFIPVTLSWLWTLGLMHFLGLKFNIINVIITSFIFGLGIDYSIFMIRSLLQEYQFGVARLKIYKTSVLLSVITTLTGIGVMVFAKHPALQSIAGISVIGIISVVVFAFTLQPLLFHWLFYRKDGHRREYPLTLGNTLKTLVIYGLLAAGTLVVTLLALVIRFFTLPFPEQGKYIVHWMICHLSRFYVRVSFFPYYKLLNPFGEDFVRPAVVIANHQSHIDTTIMFSLTPKVVILTKDWVRQFPLYYIICRLADFYTVSDGLDAIGGRLEERVRNGYHVCIFPEGSRSVTDTPKRFHKGAVVLADTFEMDILPVYIHGTGRYLRKGSFWGQSNDVTVEVGERISFAQRQAEHTDTKPLYQAFKQHHKQLAETRESCFYHRRQLIENYIYKGAILEWYLRVKLRLEDYYAPFDRLVPRTGYIVDLGCGYGFMDYMLHFRAPERRILGVDYDPRKITTAQHCQARSEMLEFIAGDITEVDFNNADAIVISDVLHYLEEDKQMMLLERAYARLADHGRLIIRDGDRDLEHRHRGTRLTEWFSTNVGFNKTQNALHYISGTQLTQWAVAKGLSVDIIDNTRL